MRFRKTATPPSPEQVAEAERIKELEKMARSASPANPALLEAKAASDAAELRARSAVPGSAQYGDHVCLPSKTNTAECACSDSAIETAVTASSSDAEPDDDERKADHG